ncbi:phage replisome organizer N-terminal domain-containing protein [Francisellaceae bacterium CB299]
MKKYYWLKLKNNFFSQREIKKLRNIAGGDTYVIIYLKLQLHSLENVGKILYAETEESIYEQLSYDLDEDQQNIQVTIKFLVSHRLIEMVNDQDISMIETKELIGSESESASRVRRHRDKNKSLHCNDDVTIGNKLVTTETEQDKQIEKKKETETQTQLENDDNSKKKYSFSSNSNSDELEIIKNHLHSLGLNSSQATKILTRYSIGDIDQAVLSTHNAFKANKIKTKPFHYLNGILQNMSNGGVA